MDADAKHKADVIAAIIKLLAKEQIEFALVLYPFVPGQKKSIFLASDPPPDGAARLRATLEEIEGLEGVMVVGAETEH